MDPFGSYFLAKEIAYMLLVRVDVSILSFLQMRSTSAVGRRVRFNSILHYCCRDFVHADGRCGHQESR